mmetsp:Transcript_15208/g.28430  ORF Transcript_15208/g.28430 Transcript_15208/m.28430 type:complete len:1275 (+) Transcript_15208:241-4065(+)
MESLQGQGPQGLQGQGPQGLRKPPSAEELAAAADKLEKNANLLVKSNDSEIIRQTLRLYGSLFVGLFLLFCYLRRRFPKLYNVRSWAPKLKCRLALMQSYGFFSWAWDVFKVSDDDLLHNCGMDATCFVRCLRLGIKLSLVGCFNAIWLIPTFYTATGLEELEEEDKFVLMSVANLHPGSPRFAAVVVAAYITVIMSLYLLSNEYQWYIEYRHKFLSLRKPRNFTIYVAGIPESLRSDYALADFFQRTPGKSPVLEANVAMNIPKLEAKVAKRQAVLEKLEHAMAEEKVKGTVKKHRTFNIQHATSDIARVTESVESVRAYRNELEDLNKAISLEIGNVRNSNHRLRRHLTRQKSDSNVLRGRLLTPADEIEAGIEELQNGSETDFEGEDFYGGAGALGRPSSINLFETHSIITDEVPEEDVYIPEADFPTLSPVLSNSEEEEVDEKQGAKTSISDVHGQTYDIGAGLDELQCMSSVGDDEECIEFTDDEDDEQGIQDSSRIVTGLASFGDSDTQTETQSSQAHPFLQLVGLGELREIGDSSRLSLASTLGDTVESSPDIVDAPSAEDSQVKCSDKNPSLTATDLESGAADDATTNEEGNTSESILNIQAGTDDIEKQNSQDSGNTEVENHQEKRSSITDVKLKQSANEFEELNDDSREPLDSSRDAIYTDQEVTNGVSVDKQRTLISQNSGTSLKTNSNSSLSSGSGFRRRANSSMRNVRGSIANSVRVENVTESVRKARDYSVRGSKAVTDIGLKSSKTVVDIGVKGTKTVRDIGLKGSKTVRDGTIKATHGAKKVAELSLKKAHHQLAENAAALAPILRTAGEGAPRPAGFVVFKNYYTTQAALQMLQHPAATKMLVEDAPCPSEVYWRNVGLPDKARRTGSLLSVAATSALCLFWSFPVAFISSLTEVHSLKVTMPRLGLIIEKSPALEMGLAVLAPLLLLGLNEGILPIILKWFAEWEGHISSPRLEASLFRKMSAFAVIQTFFISTISGSLTAELANMVDNPEKIIELLAITLPTQSSYFIQYLFVFTFLINGLELLRVVPLSYALARRFIGPNLTEKERSRSWKFLYSLADPPSFWHAETFSQIVLFYVVFFVYATMSPITCVFLLACFVILESGYRYNFIHNYPTSPDSGGRIWAGFVIVIYASIFIGELTLIGLLILNEAFYSVPALLPLLIVTILFIINVHPKRMHVAGNLPAIKCIELDKQMEEGAEPSNYDFLRNQYLQPALKEPILFPDEDSLRNLSLSPSAAKRQQSSTRSWLSMGSSQN